MELIGTKIQTLRKNKNLTQAQLAEVLSVSSQSVSKWENNLSAPDITLLPIIARFFGITMDELFSYRLDALNYKERFIRFMADNGMLRFGEFKRGTGETAPYCISIGNYKTGSQILKLGEFYAECFREHNINASLLIGSTGEEIPIITAMSMVLYNKYGYDVCYGVDSTRGKRPNARDEVTLIKNTLISGDTLKATLQRLQEAPGIPVSNVIVSVNCLDKGHRSAFVLQDIEREYGVKIHSIITLDDIIYALENGVIAGAEHLEAMRSDRVSRIGY